MSDRFGLFPWAAGLLLVASGVTGQTQTTAPSRLKEVIVVHKTHFDIGYTALTREVLERYRTSMIDNALDLAEHSRELPADQRFVWTIPGWPLTQILWEGQTPERRARVLAALGGGQFVVHALPFTTHTESLDMEDLVRGMGISSRLARALSVELPRDAKMTDVPCHSWILPTVLKHAGVDFLHLGSNSMSSGPDLPSFGTQEQTADGRLTDLRQALFWWEGPDGSRLLTMYSRTYGSGLVPPADWPYSTWLALIHTGDNAGPPSPESVRKLLEEAQTRLPGVKVRFGRLSDFADALLKENPRLPVVRADMPDPWIYGVMSMPAETALARNTRPRIRALETLNTLLRFWTGQADAARAVAAAYEQSLLYSEHTWGMNTRKFPRSYGAKWQSDRAAGTFARLEESWGEHRDYARRAAALAGPQLEANLKALSAAAGVPGKRIAVFNALPWPRQGVVEAKFSATPPRALRDEQTGALTAVETEDGVLRFIAKDLPPLGYRTYSFVDRAAPAHSGLIADRNRRTIENQFLRVTLDPAAGRIASVLDKSSARELLDPRVELGLYLHQQFDTAEMERFVKTYTKPSLSAIWNDFGKPGMPPAGEWPRRLAGPRNLALHIRQDAVSVAAVMEAEPSAESPYRIALAVTLYDGLPYADIAWKVRNKSATPGPEAGWLSFALNVSQPRFRLARLGAVIDPAADTIRGSNHDVYCLAGGVAVLDPKLDGVGLCPLDSPLVSLDHPGLWEYSQEFAATKPRVFVNLYNNLWGTNFAQWIEGSWTSRVRLWSVHGYQPFEALVRPSQESRTALAGVPADGPAGKLPALRAGLRVSRPGVAVTAFGENPDGAGLILRLWEQAGQDGSTQVCLPDGVSVRTAQPADLRGRAQGSAIPVRDGCFSAALRHYAPASYLLRPEANSR